MQTVIIQLLEEMGRTRHWFAKEIGSNRANLYAVANGTGRATKPTRARIAGLFCKDEQILFHENGMARRVEE